jgi:hypothetical protein
MQLYLVKRYLFLGALGVFIFTFFSRNNCRSVDDIHQAVLGEPIQSLLSNSQDIEFTNNDYAYQATPLYDYEINGLIVSKINYRVFNIEKVANAFPVDLCMIWGSNVASRVYRNRAVSYSQDCRWCWARWSGDDITYNLNEQSNNHLLINNKELEKVLNSLVVGDQVKIRGKLVNLSARLIGKGGAFDRKELTWNSSTTRTDSGAGACEVIYVEGIEVLKKANVLSYYLFRISFYTLIIMTAWGIIRFFAVK